MDWIWFLVAAAAGAGATYAFFSQKAAVAAAGQRTLSTHARDLAGKLSAAEEDLKKYIANYTKVHTQCEGLEERLREERQQQETLFEKHKNDFRQLSQAVVEQGQKKLSEESKLSMDAVIKPLRTQLEELRAANQQAVEQRGALKAHIEALKAQNKTLGEEAHALTTALRGSSKTQGDLGEMMLERLLEQSGLRKGTHYKTQASTTDASGKRYRPDVWVNLPEGRVLIIDSKVSLQSYQDYVNHKDEAQAAHLKAYITSVRNHIRDLKGKDYARLATHQHRESLDYVLMFMPIEAAFLLALREDTGLFEEAWKPPQSIVLVSPTTLLATLRIVHHMWRQSDQQKHAQEIARTAATLYEKLATFLKEIETVGSHLHKAQESYDSVHKRMTTNRKGEIPQLAARMKALGTAPRQELPPSFVAEAEPSAADTPSVLPVSDPSTQGDTRPEITQTAAQAASQTTAQATTQDGLPF